MSHCLSSIFDKYNSFLNFHTNNVFLEILCMLHVNILHPVFIKYTASTIIAYKNIHSKKIYDSFSNNTVLNVLKMKSLKEFKPDLSTISDETEEGATGAEEPLDGEGPRFQQYLEDEGILDYLTLQLMTLFKSGSPINGLDRFKQNISKEAVKKAQLEAEEEAKLGQEAMQLENEALKYRVEYLETANKKMKLQIDDIKRNT